MPYIQAKLSVNLDESQKDNIQSKLTELTSHALSKPSTYIMSEIESNCDLYMGGNKIEKGAYISISLLGSTNKSACQSLTANICEFLTDNYGLAGNNIYITYHPVDLWGWNGSMF